MKLPHILSSNGKQKCIIILLFSLFGTLIYCLNSVYPLYSDDWGHSFIHESNPLKRISGFADIFQSQHNYYLTWGGRNVVHIIAQILLWIGEKWADIFNTLAYMLYMTVVYFICNQNRRTNPFLFLVIGLLLWFFIPAFDNSVLWITGSANYLWGTLIVLGFLYAYYTYFINENSNDTIFKSILFLLVGIVSGWTNENMLPVQLFFILALIISFRKKQITIPRWAILGLVGVCIGGAIMLLAPGNFLRAEMVSTNLNAADESIFDTIIYRIGKLGYRYLVYILPLSILYATLLYLYTKRFNKNNINKKVVFASMLFFLSAHLAWLAMLISPIFPPRAAFGMVSFIIVAIGIIYANIDTQNRIWKITRISIVAVAIVLFGITYRTDYKEIYNVSSIFEQRIVYIDQQKEEGNTDILFTKTLVLPNTDICEDLSENETYWLNKMYADYYGLNTVRILKAKN